MIIKTISADDGLSREPRLGYGGAMRIFAVFALLLLSGCTIFGQPGAAYECPGVGLIEEAENVSLPDVSAKIGNFSYECSFRQPHPVRTDIAVPMTLTKKDPASALQQRTLPYFIAVLGPDETVLQKNLFTAAFEFEAGKTEAHTIEEHVVYIHVRDAGDAYKYKIVMGFVQDRAALKAEEEAKQKAAQEKATPPKAPKPAKKPKKKGRKK